MNPIEKLLKHRLTKPQKLALLFISVWLLSVFLFWLSGAKVERGETMVIWFLLSSLLSVGLTLIASEEIK